MVVLCTVVLFMDSALCILWIAIGVFDNRWNEITILITILVGGLIVNFIALLFIAMLCGLSNRLSTRSKSSIKLLSELEQLIDDGWDRAIETVMTCSGAVLTVLIVLGLIFWRDFLWWSEICRGSKASEAGQFRDATTYLEQSVEVAGPDRVPFSYFLLAKVYFKQKQYLDAERQFQHAIQALGSPTPNSQSLLIACNQGLARAFLEQGKYKDAQQASSECLSLFGPSNSNRQPLRPVQLRVIGNWSVPNSNPGPTLAGSYTLLEEAYVRQGRLEESKKALIENLAEAQHQSNREGVAIDVEKAVEGYMDILVKDAPKSYVVESIPDIYKRAGAVLAEKFGAESIEWARQQARYGNRLYAAGELEQANTIYENVLTILEKKYPQDRTTLSVLNKLGNVLADRGRFTEAEQMYKKVIEIAGKVQNKSSGMRAQIDTCLADYARLLRKLKREDEAKNLRAAVLESNH